MTRIIRDITPPPGSKKNTQARIKKPRQPNRSIDMVSDANKQAVHTSGPKLDQPTDVFSRLRTDNKTPQSHAAQAQAPAEDVQKVPAVRRLMRFARHTLVPLCLLGISLVIAYTAASSAIIQKHAHRALPLSSNTIATLDQHRVGIVFGGGISDNGPLPLLRDRLDLAADLLEKGHIEKLILSGDNRFLNYNEPQAMLTYLNEQRGILLDQLQPDFAGRSTYETCERAAKVFGLDKAILISESTHLPRAIYLCDHFGIDAYGIQSDGEASSGLKVGQRWREVLARSKALFNTNVWGEPTVLGDPIDLIED